MSSHTTPTDDGGSWAVGVSGDAASDVAARSDQGLMDSILLEDSHRLVYGITFGDSAQVQTHAAVVQPRGAARAIEMQLLVASQSPRFR